MNDSPPIGPNDKTIVIDQNNCVLFSDFPPRKTTPNEKPHLQDILAPNDLDIYRIIGLAIDRPGRTVESDVTFRSESLHLLVLHVAAPPIRTFIVFQPGT